MDNYNYPVGADRPDAPWNQVDTPERNFDVVVIQSLIKRTEIRTDDFRLEIEYDEGFSNEIRHTDNTDWVKAYHEDGKYTPLELINKFKEFLEQNLPDKTTDRKKYRQYTMLIKECEGWEEQDDLYVEEE